MACAERVAIRRGTRSGRHGVSYTHDYVRGGALHALFALRGGDWVARGRCEGAVCQAARPRPRVRFPPPLPLYTAAGSRTHKIQTRSGRQNLPLLSDLKIRNQLTMQNAKFYSQIKLLTKNVHQILETQYKYS